MIPHILKYMKLLTNLNNKGMIANPITLKNFFEKDNMLNDVGGTEYLVNLQDFLVQLNKLLIMRK